MIKPSEIKTDRRFFDTPLQNLEEELVARNIVVFSKQNGDHWFPFSFAEYKRLCSHRPNYREEEALRSLAFKGYLSADDDWVFRIKGKFFAIVAEYLSPQIEETIATATEDER